MIEEQNAADSTASGELLRISTGSPAADRILGDGFPTNSINMIMGEPGTGKTLLAQQLVFHTRAAIGLSCT
ncbi:hypothetical protein BH23GEM10_BH23GEM10_16800 [soil metagenome]